MFVHVFVAVTWRRGVWLGGRRGRMTSSFQKIYGLAVQTKTQRRRFQIYPLWDPVSKNIGFTLPKRRIPCGRNAYPIKKFVWRKKRKISEMCCFPLKRDWIVQAPLIGTQPISNHIQLSAKDFMTSDWIEVQYTHTHTELSHIDCVCENGVIQLKVFSPAFACMSMRGRGLKG